MLGTILAGIGFVLVGVGVLVAAVFGLAWIVAREVNSGGHGKGCPCDTCQEKRLKQWEAEKRANNPPVNPHSKPIPQDRKPIPARSTWMSTVELQAGMIVYGKTAVIFRVDAITPIDYGYIVRLVNPLTEKTTEVPVAADKAAQRIWLVRRRKGVVE